MPYIYNYNASLHNRFLAGFPKTTAVPNPNFIAAKYDWSGVGWASNHTYVANMITPIHFVTAAHHKPPIGDTIKFVRSNGDITTGVVQKYSYTRTFEKYVSDLAIGWLANPVDVENYPIVVTENWYYGRKVFVYGRDGKCGTNIIDGISTTSTGSNPTYVVYYTYDPLLNSTGDSEAGSISGDSSSPCMTTWQDRLVLVGTHFSVNGSPPSKYKSYDSFLPRYIDQITKIVEPTGYKLKLLDGAGSEGVLGDLNSDGVVNASDIDLLSSSVRNNSFGRNLDLNNDGVVNKLDLDVLIGEILKTNYGDVNLDGIVSIADLQVLAEHYGKDGGWASGDFTGDGKITMGDLVILSENYNSTAV